MRFLVIDGDVHVPLHTYLHTFLLHTSRVTRSPLIVDYPVRLLVVAFTLRLHYRFYYTFPAVADLLPDDYRLLRSGYVYDVWIVDEFPTFDGICSPVYFVARCFVAD